MIPVVTLDNKGEVIGQQAFNDNLTVVEQINRTMLSTLFCAQQKLTNDNTALVYGSRLNLFHIILNSFL